MKHLLIFVLDNPIYQLSDDSGTHLLPIVFIISASTQKVTNKGELFLLNLLIVGPLGLRPFGDLNEDSPQVVAVLFLLRNRNHFCCCNLIFIVFLDDKLDLLEVFCPSEAGILFSDSDRIDEHFPMLDIVDFPELLVFAFRLLEDLVAQGVVWNDPSVFDIDFDFVQVGSISFDFIQVP